jgi:hypothetical protein
LEKNDRTKEEFNRVIKWFTCFNLDEIQALIEEKVTFETFFKKAKTHPNAYLIRGVVCLSNQRNRELYKQRRQLKKLIDELARGRKMKKILREEKK